MAKIGLYLCGLALLGVGCGVDEPTDAAPPEPVEQQPIEAPAPPERYRMAFEFRPLIREYLLDTWGHDDYLSLAGAQVQQESAWNCAARSKFADGCAQFTPDTWKWARKSFCRWAPSGTPYDPEASLPCMVLYDYWIWQRVTGAREIDRINKMLSAYNGGLGWISRDEKICESHFGCDPAKWDGHVSEHSDRADWAIKENRNYMRFIVHRHQPQYFESGYGGRLTQ